MHQDDVGVLWGDRHWQHEDTAGVDHPHTLPVWHWHSRLEPGDGIADHAENLWEASAFPPPYAITLPLGQLRKAAGFIQGSQRLNCTR